MRIFNNKATERDIWVGLGLLAFFFGATTRLMVESIRLRQELQRSYYANYTQFLAMENKQQRLQSMHHLKVIKGIKTTGYCHCKKCCGKSDGITASGTKVKVRRTIAVDKRVIPLGSRVWINGRAYIAEDTGSAIKGKRIDIYYSDHQEALEHGVRYCDVYVETNPVSIQNALAKM